MSEEKAYGCPVWLRFLAESVGSRAEIQLLQEFFGYCGTGMTRYQKSLLLVGGGVGKTLTLQVLRLFTGEEEWCSLQFSSLASWFYRALLENKKVCHCFAVESGTDLAATWFKALVSGDRITAAVRGENVFSYVPFVKLVCDAQSAPPDLRETIMGRRIVTINFSHRPAQMDHHLLEKIVEEMDEIEEWAADGLDRLIGRGGFAEPGEGK
jgi:putative DNA primase/helicase